MCLLALARLSLPSFVDNSSVARNCPGLILCLFILDFLSLPFLFFLSFLIFLFLPPSACWALRALVSDMVGVLGTVASVAVRPRHFRSSSACRPQPGPAGASTRASVLLPMGLRWVSSQQPRRRVRSARHPPGDAPQAGFPVDPSPTTARQLRH